MEINLNVLSEKKAESTTTVKTMRLSKNSESAIFQIFTKNIYSNPIGTVVREITSNCFDSHIEAGVENTPVLIKHTHDTQTDTHFISFIDYGVGMSPDRIENIYGVYFESTKRKTNAEIGGFGLGGKTPLAYKRFVQTDDGKGNYDNSFEVITNYNGTKYHYLIFEAEKAPAWTLQYKEKTTERNGTEIRIPVLAKDIDKFEEELIRQLYYFEGIIFDGFSEKVTNDYQIVRGKTFLYRGDDVDEFIHVCLGKVYYPIDYNVLGLNKYDYRAPIAIDVPIGKINVTVSRESLDYSETTITYLKKKLEEVIDELKFMLIKKAENVVNLEDYYEFIKNYGFLKLAENKTIRIQGLINVKNIKLPNYRYSKIDTPKSNMLMPLFFNINEYGKKSPKRRYGRYTDEYQKFSGTYDDLLECNNIYYSDEPEFKKPRIRQSYLKNKHGRFYVLTKRNLVDYWFNFTDVFRLNYDSKESFLKSNAYKLIVKMQEDFVKIIHKHAKDYNNVIVPDDFKLSYNNKNLSSDTLNKKISVKILGMYGRNPIPLKKLNSFKGNIFYSTYDNESELYTIYNIFKTLFNGKHIETYYNDYKENFANEKSSIMFIIVSKSNLKFVKMLKNTYSVDQFYWKYVHRKHDLVVKSLQNIDARNKYDKLDALYCSEFFASIAPDKWKRKIEEVKTHMISLKDVPDLDSYKQWLGKYITTNECKKTATEKYIEKLIDDLINLEEKNSKILSFITFPYYSNIDEMDKNKKEILKNILRKIMLF